MRFDPQKHKRKSIRLKGYDYSAAGYYFVTICVQNRLCLLENTAVSPMIEKWWDKLPEKFPQLELDAFVIMPNHIHGIIILRDMNDNDETIGGGEPHGGQPHGVAPTSGVAPMEGVVLGDMVGWFKTMTTNEYIRHVKQNQWQPFPKRLWQRNYYEHIIRNERALESIREYIHNNPANWLEDQLHPEAPPNKFNTL